jgi:hypothetical protein
MADETTTTLRRCIGSKRFGIEAHDAPVEDFPKQPSQKDGLGRMCRTHWNQYTAGLARDAKARKAAETPPAEDANTAPAHPEPKSRRSDKPQVATEGDAQPS